MTATYPTPDTKSVITYVAMLSNKIKSMDAAGAAEAADATEAASKSLASQKR